MTVPHIPNYKNLEPEKRSRELDKRAELQAELEVLRGPKSNYGTVQRWNYVVGGRRQWMAD